MAFRVVSGFVAGFAQSEVAGLLAKSGVAARGRKRIEAASGGRLKRLAEIAAVGLPGNAEREFRAGLDLVLAETLGPSLARSMGRHAVGARRHGRRIAIQ